MDVISKITENYIMFELFTADRCKQTNTATSFGMHEMKFTKVTY